MRSARSARDPRCRPIFAHLRKPIPFAPRKGVMLHAPGAREISQPRSNDSKATSGAPCGATYSEMWSIFAPSTAAGAHESRINPGGYRNSAGEWCCGDNDCESPGQIAVTGKGWVIGGKEFVPFDEATPSPDGKIWICRRPDHTRRCVFGPPPGS